MMAELASPWGKFGYPSGQVQQMNCPIILLLYSQTPEGPRKYNSINLTYVLSEFVLRNTN